MWGYIVSILAFGITGYFIGYLVQYKRCTQKSTKETILFWQKLTKEANDTLDDYISQLQEIKSNYEKLIENHVNSIRNTFTELTEEECDEHNGITTNNMEDNSINESRV